jgi:hypothetical protein
MRFNSDSCVVLPDEQVSASLGRETVIELSERGFVREVPGGGDAALS